MGVRVDAHLNPRVDLAAAARGSGHCSRSIPPAGRRAQAALSSLVPLMARAMVSSSRRPSRLADPLPVVRVRRVVRPEAGPHAIRGVRPVLPPVHHRVRRGLRDDVPAPVPGAEVVEGHVGDQPGPPATAAGAGQVRGGEPALGQHSPQPVVDAEQRLHDQVRKVVDRVHGDLPGGSVRHAHPGPVERGGLALDEGDLGHSLSLASSARQPDGGSTGARAGTVSG